MYLRTTQNLSEAAIRFTGLAHCVHEPGTEEAASVLSEARDIPGPAGKEKGLILVTAFMPFGGDAVNPTEQALAMLPDSAMGYSVRKLLLPVEFGRAADIAEAAFDRLSPAAVVLLGQAGGRSAVTPEAEAKNLMDARIPDNAGARPEGRPVVADGEARLFSTLPNEAIIRAVRSLGLPAELSHDAGAYVCNSLLYRMLHHAGGRVPTGFIHVPFVRSQVEGDASRSGTPYMELCDIAAALGAALSAVAASLG